MTETRGVLVRILAGEHKDEEALAIKAAKERGEIPSEMVAKGRDNVKLRGSMLRG
jgi:hypothetical protein